MRILLKTIKFICGLKENMKKTHLGGFLLEKTDIIIKSCVSRGYNKVYIDLQNPKPKNNGLRVGLSQNITETNIKGVKIT